MLSPNTDVFELVTFAVAFVLQFYNFYQHFYQFLRGTTDASTI